MWFFIIGDSNPKNETRKLIARVEYLNLQPQVTVRSLVSEVLVEVEALARDMENLAHDSIVCEIDLKGFSSGKYRTAVRPKLPPNVILKSVSPSELDIELVRQVARVLPIEVTLPQDIPAGQYLESVEVVPREINVKASETDMAKIGSVNIEPTFFELQTGKELLLPVNVTQSQPFEDEVIIEPAQVRINATLVTGIPRKKAPVNVRLAGKPSVDYEVRSLTTDPAEVMVQGVKDKLDMIHAVDTETVDITNLSADQTVVVPLRALADGVSIMNVSAVRLSIRLEPIYAQKLVANVAVVVDGAGEAKWTADPPVVDVTVEAPPSVMEAYNFTASQLRAFVDVSGIFLRRAVLPVWAAPASNDFRIVKVEPSTVSVGYVDE
jgi:YbbR domain-containing protein